MTITANLTSLARVTEWLDPSSGTLDESNNSLLQRLIANASYFVVNYMGRNTLAATPFDEYLDSGGRNFILVRQWPVISISSIEFCGQSVTQIATGNPPATGYLLEPPPEGGGQQRLTVYPWCFPRGRNTVHLTYTAGYQIQNESYVITDVQTPPAADPISTALTWIQDDGVTIGGVAATRVSASPASGQYAMSATNQYLFSAADVGKTAAITYSYVPPDVEQATIELVGERFRQKDRIGINSKSLPNGGGTTSFLVKDMSDHIKTILQPYRRVTPT